MTHNWWKESVVYQIYPRSFMDSNGDGIGDLQGIISKLDYLQTLGVDVIWLSPIYASPNDDNGYDISDYRSILPEFGTMDDFDELLAAAHARGLKVIMDLVVNHTSDEHAWFVEARQSRESPYRDYYIWKPGKDGQAPNNWESNFGGSAWEYDEATDEYYLHLFSKKQPDLNWENPRMRRDIYDMMTWWLDKGIDGFRMDVINFISKHPDLPDGERIAGKKYASGSPYYVNGPRVHAFLQEMNAQVLSRHDLLTVGEMPGVTVEEAQRYTGEDRQELNMVFQFEHVGLGSGPNGKWSNLSWKLPDLKRILSRWQYGLAETGWNSLYWNNHDQPRVVSKFGDDGAYRVESAKMLATCLHLMQGTPYIYQGEELGMTNVAFPSIAHYRDIETINFYNEAMRQEGSDEDDVLAAIHAISRDNARTPMQWNAEEQAGFTTGTPWLAVNPNYRSINAAQALSDEHSVFYYYQQLIRLRKQYPLIVYGRYELLLPDDEQIFAYTRTLGKEQLLVLCNFSASRAVCELPAPLSTQLSASSAKVLIANYDDREREQEQVDGCLDLRPYEAVAFLLER
ncbi:glycoside hydrolase family 13 protein [Numidum massiliense]|uniref:glycoside hydrolase family 13 protein n=1 Tax=Numidum massiliense TaxID=1522315 RepID=UPI0006D58B9B|nr:alpha-glucosidase [Numidum massiliense]